LQVLSDDVVQKIEARADVVVEFPLAEYCNSPALASYSLSAILDIARRDPIKAVAMIREGEQLVQKLAAPAQASGARVTFWGRVVGEATSEMSALVRLIDSAKVRGVERGFVADSKVALHVKALARLVVVAVRCARSIEQFAGGKRNSAEGLLLEWRALCALGGWSHEAVTQGQASVFNEPKCWVCWHFIAPLQAVACLHSQDAPCHVPCANLLANRMSDVKEM
jgi:hypothetical protein